MWTLRFSFYFSCKKIFHFRLNIYFAKTNPHQLYYLSPIVTWFIRQRFDSVHHFMEHPFEAQELVFQNLIQSSSLTEWGKKYEYDSISDFKKFSERIPVQDYDTLKPWISRMMNGEQNILWHSEIRWFAKSSGTTSDKSKFIPVSMEAMEECHFKGALDLLGAYCFLNEDTKIFNGKGLIIGGSHQINNLNAQSSYGDLSAVLLQNMSFIGQLWRTPQLSIALMDEWEQKIEKLAHSTLKEDVTNISGVPTWTMILIKRLFDLTGKNNLREIWPNLELYIHGGVSFTPYREQFKSLMKGEGMNFYESYNASEGFFAFQFGKRDEDLLLHLNNGIFYEFIPMNELGKDFPKTVLIDEVKVNENYALVISTNSGLWRYMVGDTIQFTSIKPFRIKVTGRVKQFINAFGEEVIADNTDNAIAKTCKETSSVVSDYTVAPVYLTCDDRGCHEWLIEFDREPEDLIHFTELLDKNLRALNSDYDAKRYKDIALKEPTVRVLPKNSFYNWLKKKGKLGGQHKVPRLSNDRIYVDDILGMIHSEV